jgi:hypothetical protein
MTFDGLTSRCVMPAAWALLRASAICTAYSSAWPVTHPARGDDLGQRVPFQVLHDDEVDVTLRADLVDGDDVGVVQSAGSSGLADESLTASRVRYCARQEKLRCNKPVQLQVARAVDDAHAALPETRLDPVMGERLTDHGWVV